MKILANATVTKLKEYSKSYGAPENIEVSFIKEFDNEIQLFNYLGSHLRTMRKGTKLLKSFYGVEITERTFKSRTKKNHCLSAKKSCFYDVNGIKHRFL